MKSGGDMMSMSNIALRVLGSSIKGITPTRKAQVQQIMTKVRAYVKQNKAALLAECDKKYSDAAKSASEKAAINKLVNEGPAKMKHAELPEFVKTFVAKHFTPAEYNATYPQAPASGGGLVQNPNLGGGSAAAADPSGDAAVMTKLKKSVANVGNLPTDKKWSELSGPQQKQFIGVLKYAIKKEGKQAQYPTVDDAVAEKVWSAAGYGKAAAKPARPARPARPAKPDADDDPDDKPAKPGKYRPFFPKKGKTPGVGRMITIGGNFGIAGTGAGTDKGHEGSVDMNLNTGGDPKMLYWDVKVGSLLWRFGKTNWGGGLAFSFSQRKFGPKAGSAPDSDVPGATYRTYVPSLQFHYALSQSGRWNFVGDLGLEIMEVRDGDFGDLGRKEKFMLYGPRLELGIAHRRALGTIGGKPIGIEISLTAFGGLLFTTQVPNETGSGNTSAGRGYDAGVKLGLSIFFGL